MFGTRKRSTSPDTWLVMPLCRAASGLTATSRAMGPSTTQSGKAPDRQSCTRPWASTVAGILGLTCSLAHSTATLGVAMPMRARASTALARIWRFSARPGAMFMPPPRGLQGRQVAQEPPGAQAALGVQGRLEEHGAVDQTLHEHLGLAIVHHPYGQQGCPGQVGFMDDAHLARDLQFLGPGTDDGLVPHQGGLDQPGADAGLDRLHDLPVLGRGHRHPHGPAALGRRPQFLVIPEHGRSCVH